MRVERKESWHSYTPNRRQKQFHQVAPWGPMMVKGYIGALGGGKSTACEQEQIELMMKMPKGLSVATRKSKKRANFALVADYRTLLEGIAKYHSTDEAFYFPNGHVLAITPSDDWERFGSMEICTFFIQEAHEITDGRTFDHLCARLRNPNGYVEGKPYYRGLIDARGITSSHWINKKFIEVAWNVDDGLEARERAENPDFVYIKSRTEDNRDNLRPGYIEELAKQHKNDLNWLKVFLEGEVGFDVEGQAVFGDSWDPARHVASIPEDPSLPILRGWDFGYRAPAVVWAQYTRSGRLLVLRELCPRNLSTEQLVQDVVANQKTWWPTRPHHTYIDYGDAAGDQINSTSLKDIETVEEMLQTTMDSRKGRIEPGLNVLRKLMRDSVKVGTSLANRFAVDESCTTLIEAMSGAYYYPEENMDLGPKKGLGYDAPVDCIRYIAQLVVEEGYAPSTPSPVRYGRTTAPNLFARY